MNNKTRNDFAAYGLEILKRAVLLVLYEARQESPYGKILTAGQIHQRLDLLQPWRVCVSTNSLIHGILDHLYHEGYAYHYVGYE